MSVDDDIGVAVFAGGCFWCTEAVFAALDGVTGVTPGYVGGDAATANYDAVCSGRSGHAEAIRISYQPRRIGFGALLRVFFTVAHDPTQRHRQGHDVGTQYRSAIFPVDAHQQAVAAAYIAELDAARVFAAAIVTTLEPLGTFYPAEDHHHRYAERNPAQPYVAAVALPKLETLRQHFGASMRQTAAVAASSILAAAHVAIVVHGPDGRIITANAEAERLLGLRAGSIGGPDTPDPGWSAIDEHGAPLPGDQHPGPQALRTGRAQHGVTMGVALPNGKRRWLLVDADRFDAEGRGPCAVSCFMDITAHRRLEAWQALTLSLLEDMNRRVPRDALLLRLVAFVEAQLAGARCSLQL
ncbi:MAG TPA: peptide-methionine (S)-S-oxide reductase, partial [Xanthomonadaceae bacterium]|nr:peptide-methionine (S)-S-oxide reductase [Xanthomonadaceae bacterium]